MSALISIDYIAAQALQFVLGGAGKQDPESVILIEPVGDNEYKISTNTGATYRHVFVSTNGTVHTVDGDTAGDTTPTCAIRATALTNAVKLIGEDEVLSMQLDDDTVRLSSGAVSFTMDNLYDDVMKVKNPQRTTTLVTAPGEMLISSLNRAKNTGDPSGDVAFVLSANDSTISVCGGDHIIRSKETIGPVTITEDTTIHIPKRFIKEVKNDLVTKAGVDTVDIKSDLGVVELVMRFAAGDATSVTTCHYTFPQTVGESTLSAHDPCDEDNNAIFVADKKDIKSSVASVANVVRGGVPIEVSTSAANNQVTITATDGDGSAKTVVFNADVSQTSTLVVSPHTLLSSLNCVSKGQVEIGTLTFEETPYMTITPLFDDKAEEDTTNPDMIVSLAVVSIGE